MSSRLGLRASDPIFRVMCGRARLSSDVSAIKLIFSIPPTRPTPNIAPSWKVAPTDPLPVVRYDAKAGERSLDVMRWGLVRFWAKDIKVGFANINAKAEGIEGKPAFRDAFQRRRCLVPVDNFYEWKKTPTGKQPYGVALGEAAHPLAHRRAPILPQAGQCHQSAVCVRGAMEGNWAPGYQPDAVRVLEQHVVIISLRRAAHRSTSSRERARRQKWCRPTGCCTKRSPASAGSQGSMPKVRCRSRGTSARRNDGGCDRATASWRGRDQHQRSAA
jgi:SOS response associated peptidase (SRAP)